MNEDQLRALADLVDAIKAFNNTWAENVLELKVATLSVDCDGGTAIINCDDGVGPYLQL